MSALMGPRFRKLGATESRALLRRNHVGRMAFSFRNRVDILPIHYVYANGWVNGRTSLGAKLVTIAHSRWVAFEVDEIEGLFDWRSVVVHGGVYLLRPDGSPAEVAARLRAIKLLQRLIPRTMTGEDPVPFRNIVFRIHVDEISGRAAASQ